MIKNTYATLITLTMSLLSFCLYAQHKDFPIAVHKLVSAYPQTITGYDGTYLIMKDGKKIKYNQGGNKNHNNLMNSSDIGDIFTYEYPIGVIDHIAKNHDPGRVRSEELLKAMYGATKEKVSTNLTTITWCPNLVNQKLRVTTINGVDKQLQKISDELDKHPQLKEYLKSTGTFNWRRIKGTDRLSTHSFGIAIDIALKYANYWQWDCRCSSENVELKYKNNIPQLIIDIFEKHGFIWGGKWYHYDTMHFEYRPEFFVHS